MKIRNGFVSNSSSSSFLIGIKKDREICPHCGRKDISIIEMLPNNSTNDTQIDYSQEELFLKINNEIKETTKKIELLELKGISYLKKKYPQYIEWKTQKGITEQEIVEKDKTDWKNDLEEMKKYEKELEKAAETYQLYQISIDNSDISIRNIIKQQIKSGNIIDFNWIADKYDF